MQASFLISNLEGGGETCFQRTENVELCRRLHNAAAAWRRNGAIFHVKKRPLCKIITISDIAETNLKFEIKMKSFVFRQSPCSITNLNFEKKKKNKKTAFKFNERVLLRFQPFQEI